MQMTSKCFSWILESWLIGCKWIAFIEEKNWYMKTDPRRSLPFSGPILCHFSFCTIKQYYMAYFQLVAFLRVLILFFSFFNFCCVRHNPFHLHLLTLLNFGEHLRGQTLPAIRCMSWLKIKIVISKYICIKLSIIIWMWGPQAS